jgi:choline transport protein
MGWLGAFSSTAYLAGSQIPGLVTLTHSSYVPAPWQVMLLFWAFTTFSIFVNIGASKLLPKFEGIVLILHIAGFFAILFPLAYLGEHNTAKEVFGTFDNEGGWSGIGLAFFVGMVGNLYAFTGSDAAIHV